MGSNQRPPNSSNMPQNSMATQQQQQPQTGMVFPQNSVLFGNPNACMNNGQAMGMPNMPLNQNAFLNHPNQLLQLQNCILGLAQLGMINTGLFNMGGFGGPQNCGPNLNQAAVFPGQFGNVAQNANQVNSAHPPGQFHGHNFLRLPQQMNQGTGLPNGQFGFQNSMQNMNQFMAVPGPNYNMFGCANQPAQAMGPQNPSFFLNPQFGQVNQNLQNLVPPGMDVNVLLAAATQLLQGNPSAPPSSSTAQSQQNQNLQPSMGSQGNPVTNGQTTSGQTYMNWKSSPNGRTNDWKNSPNGKFTRNKKGEASQVGFQKSQFHHMKNAQRNFNELKGQGMRNGSAGRFSLHSPTNPIREQKRSLSLPYTEQEIQQWREERRKNHPSKNNTEKKLTDKALDPNVIDKEAKLRREQLKEILAKQAELGVEVAEIPSHYLSDSEKQSTRGRFQNKHDKRGRGRHNKNDRYAKKQKLEGKDPSNIPSPAKKPTLLEKLLAADIKRDQNHLLQVFRFMAVNSYFQHWPDEPLKFPQILVRENGCEVEVSAEKGVSESQDKIMSEIFGDNVELDQDVDDDEHEEDINNGKCKDGGEEEGEIMD